MSKIWVRAGMALAVAAAVMGFGISTTKGVAPSTLVASEQTPWGPTKVDNFRLTDQNLLSKDLFRMSDA
jgi:hypothetical protein